MHLGVIGIFLKKQIDVFLGLFGLTVGNQQVRNVNVGLIVVRLQFESAAEFLVGVQPVLQFEVGLSQLIMTFGIARIDLYRIAKLNGGFLVLAFRKIALSTFKILLLAHIRVTVASGKKSGDQGQDQDQTQFGKMPHANLPGGKETPPILPVGALLRLLQLPRHGKLPGSPRAVYWGTYWFIKGSILFAKESERCCAAASVSFGSMGVMTRKREPSLRCRRMESLTRWYFAATSLATARSWAQYQ